VERRLGDALLELDSITRRLRRDCPWDREQDERSIVPHTVEEAYELAGAAHAGDDAKMLDELGDVLFQVHFLALLLEERGAGDLAAVALGAVEKLVRRHPHVFGEGDAALRGLPTDARTASDVRENWDAIKRSEPGAGAEPLDDVPGNLPALTYATKLARRASADRPAPEPQGALAGTARALDEAARALDGAGRPPGAPGDRASHGSERLYEALGDLLLATVELARAVRVDPEIALRGSAERFKDRARGSAR
jgi:uncharacterized protein YabN with tetrapyrrole methylase and pyrophosphatase domain